MWILAKTPTYFSDSGKVWQIAQELYIPLAVYTTSILYKLNRPSLPWVGGENPTIRSLIFASARKRRPLNIPTNLNSKQMVQLSMQLVYKHRIFPKNHDFWLKLFPSTLTPKDGQFFFLGHAETVPEQIPDPATRRGEKCGRTSHRTGDSEKNNKTSKELEPLGRGAFFLLMTGDLFFFCKRPTCFYCEICSLYHMMIM